MKNGQVKATADVAEVKKDVTEVKKDVAEIKAVQEAMKKDVAMKTSQEE
jgi:ribosomal protein L29